MTYAICFDFPEQTEPMFAGWVGDTLGVAPTLRTAARWETEQQAQQTLENNYAPSVREWGVVVEVAP